MSFTEKQIEALKAPLDRATVKTRQQGGKSVSYVEGYHVENEANRIFGFDGWDRITLDAKCVMERERKIGKGEYEKDGWGVSYTARVRIIVHAAGREVIREGCGAGHGIDVDLGQAHESAMKEAETDAEKRALKTFGNPFGQALYDKSQSEVADAPREQPKPAELTREQLDAIAKLDEADTLARLNVWAEDNKKLIDAAPEAVKRTMRASYSSRKKAIELLDRTAA